MQVTLPPVVRLKNKVKQQYWGGRSLVGRRVYVTPLSTGQFLAYGVHGPSTRPVFMITGSLSKELKRFCLQMKDEGAQVIGCYGPKVATDDKKRIVPACAALAEILPCPSIEDQIPKQPPDDGPMDSRTGSLPPPSEQRQ